MSLRVHGSLRSDFGEALKLAAADGMGVSMHPYYMVWEELQRGALEKVLPQYVPEELHVFAIYSARGSVPTRVRAFLEFLKQWTTTHQKWPSEG